VIVGYKRLFYWHWPAETGENYERRHWRSPIARQIWDRGTAQIHVQRVTAAPSFCHVALWNWCTNPGRHFARGRL